MRAYTFFRYTVAPEQQADLDRALSDFMCDCGLDWILTLAETTSKVAAILEQYNATVVDVKARTL